MPQGDPRPGEKYLHFKNKLYQITAIAQHSETGEKLVIYQALYGTFQTYARPFSMFVSPVDKEKYPQVKQKYRFQWVEFRKTEPVKTETTKTESVKSETTKTEPVKTETAKTEPPKTEVSQTETVKENPAKSETMETETSAKSETPSQSETVKKEMSTEDKMLAFFDADTAQERYQILLDMKGEVTNRMINNMAVVLDVVIEDGPLDLRYEELKSCLRTMQRYESSRLR